jgi:hypothetical protein
MACPSPVNAQTHLCQASFRKSSDSFLKKKGRDKIEKLLLTLITEILKITREALKYLHLVLL